MNTVFPTKANNIQLSPIFTTHLASVLQIVTQSGKGIAWTPETLITQDLHAGRLARAGNEHWDLAVEIHLFRSLQTQSETAENLWSLAKND